MTEFLLVLFFYLVTLGIVCTFSWRSNNNHVEYFLAGRTLSWWLVGCTVTATWFGAASVLTSVDLIRRDGADGLWVFAFPAIFSCGLGLVFARKISNLDAITIIDVLTSLYGDSCRPLISLVVLSGTIGVISGQMIILGNACQSVLGASSEISIILALGIMVTYSAFGGFRAVVLTDLIQLCFLVISILILVWVFTGPLSHQLIPSHPSPSGFFENLSQKIVMLIVFSIAWGLGPEMFQRISGCNSGRSAAAGIAFALVLLIFLYSMVYYCGVLASSNVNFVENVVFRVVLSFPNKTISAIVLIGIISAISSTADSSLSVASQTLAHDFIGKYLPCGKFQSGPIATAVVATIAAAIALWLQDIVQVLYLSADVYVSVIAIPLLSALLTKQPCQAAGRLSMFAGGIVMIIGLAVRQVPINATIWPPAPFATLLSLTVSAIVYYVVMDSNKALQQ